MEKQLHFDAMHRTMKMFIALLFTCLLAVGSAWGQNVTYDFTQSTDFSQWSTSYSAHTLSYDEASVIFASANKQSSGSTITNQPVTKGDDVEVVLNNSSSKMTQVSFTCTQWGAKAQTITLHYSTNGGTSYTSTGVTSTNFSISSNSLPTGTNAVKITFSNSSNQVGIASVAFTYQAAAPHTVSFPLSGTSITETSTGAGVTIQPATTTNSDYTFYGWTTSNIETETTTEPTLISLNANNVYYPTQDINLYPVFEKTITTGETYWQRITNLPDVTAGTYALITPNGSAFNGSISSGHGQITSSTFQFNDNGIATEAPEGTLELTFTAFGYGFQMYAANYGYLYSRAASSGNLAWHNQEDSYWAFNSTNCKYNDNNTLLRCYSNNSFRTYNSNNGEILSVAKKVVQEQSYYISTPGQSQVATPTFSPAAGSYDVDQTVTIACTTQGATIRYTLDGTEPTENATEYTQSITISESATLKAKAFMQGHPASEIASASYVLPTAVADIAAFKAAVAQNTSTTIRYRINGDLVVTAVNGGQVFVQDNSGQLQSNGLLLYASGNNLQIGDVINNVVGNYATYQGNTEFVPLTTPTATSTGNPTAITVTTTDLLANPTLYMHNLIKVENIHFDATNTYVTSASGTATPLKETTDLAINNNFKGLNITLKKDARADVIGITMQYTNDNGALRLQPRNNDDITLKTVYHDTVAVASCETYTWSSNDHGNDQEYTTSGIKSNIIANELTDDVYSINLKINHATTKTINQEACVTYTWTDGNGQTYTESGDYNYTTVNANGCDSIVTLHLTIFPNPDFTITLDPDRSTICVGEEVEMSLDGISEGEILLEEDFSSCTGSSSNEISGLSTFPTKSKAYNNSGSVKLGSNGSIGSITSKSLDLSSPFTVTITAEAYSSSEAGPLKVTVGDVTKSIPSLATTSTEYTLNFDAATATSKVKIATTNSAKRAILNAVVISTTGDNVVWSTQATTESITVAPTAAGSYTYSATVTDEHNCSSTVEQELTVLPHPTAVIVGNAKDTICGGATKTFTVQDANENLFSYQWYKDNVAIEGATSSTYTLTNAEGAQSGSYTVVASNIACSETSEPVALLVNAPGAPDYAFTITPNANDIYDTIYIGYCDVNHEFVEPTATHYLAGTSWAEVTFSTDAATTYDTPGDYTINWTGTDACGNTATCSQTLHIAIEACPNAQDYEGNTYASVRINCECWTTSDLKSTKYSDGSDIEGAMEYTSETFPNADNNVATYGRLYDWNSTVAKDNATLNTPNARGHIQGICPEGWYLPTNDQFMALAGYSTTTNLNNCRANQYWLDGGGNNSTGLTLLPAGCYNSSTERFENILGNNYYWNAYEYDETSAKTYVADCNCYMFTITNSNKGMGYSVRCIKERTR